MPSRRIRAAVPPGRAPGFSSDDGPSASGSRGRRPNGVGRPRWTRRYWPARRPIAQASDDRPSIQPAKSSGGTAPFRRASCHSRNPELKAILVNIFGGIMRCDVIAQALVEASRQVSLGVPLVVRMEGTNVELGKKILADSGLPILSGANMAEAAQKVVAAAQGKK